MQHTYTRDGGRGELDNCDGRGGGGGGVGGCNVNSLYVEVI